MADVSPINLEEIGYISEPEKEYIAGVDGALTPEGLREICERFSPLFPDAREQVRPMTDKDFLEWRSGLRKERKGEFAGEPFMEKFGSILMPANMLHVGIIANQFKVPFGLAFCRMCEAGMMEIKDGEAVMVKKSGATA